MAKLLKLIIVALVVAAIGKYASPALADLMPKRGMTVTYFDELSFPEPHQVTKVLDVNGKVGGFVDQGSVCPNNREQVAAELHGNSENWSPLQEGDRTIWVFRSDQPTDLTLEFGTLDIPGQNGLRAPQNVKVQAATFRCISVPFMEQRKGTNGAKTQQSAPTPQQTVPVSLAAKPVPAVPTPTNCIKAVDPASRPIGTPPGYPFRTDQVSKLVGGENQFWCIKTDDQGKSIAIKYIGPEAALTPIQDTVLDYGGSAGNGRAIPGQKVLAVDATLWPDPKFFQGSSGTIACSQRNPSGDLNGSWQFVSGNQWKLIGNATINGNANWMVHTPQHPGDPGVIAGQTETTNVATAYCR